MTSLEIILPVRNPPEAVRKSVESLVAQTDRGFSVLISDNHSSKGAELIAEAMAQLGGAGIAARLVRPPMELGRVEHWNWAHYESQADWLKPLFAGDWLEPDYVARLRAGAAANPDCRYVFANFTLHLGAKAPTVSASPWTGKFHTAEEMRPRVLSHGMQFGPPSAAAYEKTAFIAVGGYPTPLPICADSLMFCTLAGRFGVLGLAGPLCHFNIHDARFSTGLPQKRGSTFGETMTYLLMLGYHAWTDGVPVPRAAFARLLAREVRSYCFSR